MNLAELLARKGRSQPYHPAIRLPERIHADFDTLCKRAGSIGSALANRFELKPGDRTALFMRNSPEFLEVLYGCWFAGLVAVPINARLHHRELEYILSNSGARCCFATPDLAEIAAGAGSDRCEVVVCPSADYQKLLSADAVRPVSRSPTELAWLFYTSGTTGRPKGAMLSHRNLLTMAFSHLADIDSVRPGDTLLHAAPMSHGSGLYSVIYTLAGAQQLVPESGGFDVDEICRLIAAHDRVSFFAAPTMVKRIVRSACEIRTDRLRNVIYGGAPMYVSDCLEALDRFDGKLAQIYGQGETPMTITALSREDHIDIGTPDYLERLSSVGHARTSVEILIADEEDRPVASGATGDVLVRGDTVMSGYWANPEASRRALRNGWLHTGDIGCMTGQGYLVLKDRSSDVIISGGMNIYPREVEEVLLACPSVSEVSVVGRPSPEWGEEVVACVVAKPGTGLEAYELDRHCIANMARFKRPKHYLFLEELPKNNYGKVLKTALRQQVATDQDLHGFAPPPSRDARPSQH